MKKKTTIVHIIPTFAVGGAERLVLDYARLMDKKIYDVHVVSCVEDGPMRTQFGEAGIRVFVGSRKTYGGRRKNYCAVQRYIQGVKPDIMHTHLFGADLVGYMLKRGAGWPVKWVSTLHNVEHGTSFFRKVVWKWLLRSANKCIAVSQQVFQYSMKQFGLSAEQMVCVPNGIDATQFDHKGLLFSRKRVRLATVGRLTKQKGHRYLLEALSQLSFPQWTLDVFGNGELREILQTQAAELGIDQHITWHGNVAPVPYDKIDVIVQSSLWEGLSLVVLEAMVSGRVVISTDAAGAGIIEHNKRGLLVPAQDAQALARAIESVVHHKAQAARMATQARQTVLQDFSVEKNMHDVLALYTQLLTLSH